MPVVYNCDNCGKIIYSFNLKKIVINPFRTDEISLMFCEICFNSQMNIRTNFKNLIKELQLKEEEKHNARN